MVAKKSVNDRAMWKEQVRKTYMVADLSTMSAGHVLSKDLGEDLDGVDVLEDVEDRGVSREVLDRPEKDNQKLRLWKRTAGRDDP